MSTHNLCFEQKYEKISEFFFIRKFSVFGDEIFYILEWACFVMKVMPTFEKYMTFH